MILKDLFNYKKSQYTALIGFLQVANIRSKTTNNKKTPFGGA